jgi:sterol desaturase/sphingolipid hydroxylase (fatty acid hydroxylase superfamily)
MRTSSRLRLRHFGRADRARRDRSAPALLCAQGDRFAPGGGLAGDCSRAQGFLRPHDALISIFQRIRGQCVVGHAQVGFVGKRTEPVRAADLIVTAVGIIDFEVHGVGGNKPKKSSIVIQADGAEHAPRNDMPETGELLEHVLQIVVGDSHRPRIIPASTARTQYLTIPGMNWKPHLPEIFLGISLAVIAIEAALSRVAAINARYRASDAFASLGMQAGNIAMNLMMAGVVFAGLSAAYKVRLFTISPSSPWAWAAIFFLDDFIYYWFHRISHECRFWWAAHVNHHSSQEYNLSTAVRQSWTSVIVGTWTPWIPLALLGFPPTMILAQQGFNLFYQFWIHTEAVHRMPAWFEYLFNTPSHHRVHHASNPRYLDRNYAGVLMVWDRIFGSFVAERDEEPPRYGIVKNIETFNPVRIAFHEWAAIVREVFAARSVREALGVVFGPPGWRADGQGLTSKNIRAGWEVHHGG